MAQGRVKWFNNVKGYGFIVPDEQGEDLFAHYSSICSDGYRTLKPEQRVSFDISQGPKGLHAVNIQALDLNQETEYEYSTELEAELV